MEKFTKGPWSLGKHYGIDRVEIVGNDNNTMVCSVVDTKLQYDRKTDKRTIVPCAEGRANANLVAAAPELYEALDRVLDVYGLGDKEHLRIYEDAAADFYKVTGRMAPGKDSSPHAYVSADHQAETSRMWSEFCAKRRDDAFVTARAALAKARGEGK